MKSKYWTKTKEFDAGIPDVSYFKIVEEEVEENLSDGEILTEAICFSVDPFQRVYENQPGNPIGSFQTSKVIKSKNAKYPEGSIVLQVTAWKTVCKSNEKNVWYRVDNIVPSVKPTCWIGLLGMTGLTAYFGFLDFCQPNENETVMITTCAGSVGSVVGQIAKIKGCKVIGCCGSDEKVNFCKSLGFDEVFNYKTEKPWSDTLKRVAPGGIDCFFDNVGGQLASDIIYHMNYGGRISVCGAMSGYFNKTKPKADMIQPVIALNNLTIRGFVISEERFKVRYSEALTQMAKWIAEGNLKVNETITEGFENTPEAFIGMLSGDNTGKALVQL